MQARGWLALCAAAALCAPRAGADHEADDIARIFSACRKSSPDFDPCIRRAFNKVRPYFRVGIPELGVAPFDPHFARRVTQQRRLGAAAYSLVLSDVYERGWTRSTCTGYRTDWANRQIVYSQYFPEKSLQGEYEFEGSALGMRVRRAGAWNLTLRDYSQTTRVRRAAGRVTVRVNIDRIGDLELHAGNLLRGNRPLESMLDRIINAAWKPGFAVVRPLIEELVSSAFSDIWSDSFGDFPLQRFIAD